MRAGIFWNQTLSVLIDGLHNGRQNLCLDVRIIYSFQMTIHWETEYSIQYGNKSNRTSHTFLFVTRYYFAMHFNFHVKLKFDLLYTQCTPNTNNVLANPDSPISLTWVWSVWWRSLINYPSRPQSIVYHVPYFNVQRIESFHQGRDSIRRSDWWWRLIS